LQSFEKSPYKKQSSVSEDNAAEKMICFIRKIEKLFL